MAMERDQCVNETERESERYVHVNEKKKSGI